jgi:hypothetical protein
MFDSGIVAIVYMYTTDQFSVVKERKRKKKEYFFLNHSTLGTT